jgi:hypothetical protein
VVVFLLAIFFPPFRVLVLAFLRLVVFRLAAFLAARRFAGLRGFKITTSCRGMALKFPIQVHHIRESLCML